MLVIGPPADPAYYWEKGARARWLGRGVSTLVKSPQPSPRQLYDLLDGVDERGEPRWAAACRRRRLGHDLVFATPKAISLIWALGSPEVSEAVRGAHDAAVDGAFGYLERRAAWVRRGPGVDLMPTRGLLAAAFQHSVSRAGDPHLHTHVVVANAASDLNGVWSSLDSRWLFAERLAAGSLYQASLRHHLDIAGLSLQWQVMPNGLGVVSEVDDEVVAEFSQRRRQLLAVAAASGREPARPGRIAGLAGRPPRADPTVAAGVWAARARQVGFDASRFSLKPPSHAGATASLPDADALLGATGVTARRSIFTRRELVPVVASHLPRGALPSTIEARVDEILTSQAVVRIEPSADHIVRPRLAARYTTAEVLALENRLVTDAHRPARRGGVVVIKARPGPATWTALDAARQDWAGQRVVTLVASPGEARDFRAATGFDSHLIDDGPLSGHPAVVVIPGAQRLGPRTIADVLDQAAARGDTVLLLDGSRRPAALEGRDLLSRLPAMRLAAERSVPQDGPHAVDRIDAPRGSVTLCADSASRHQAAVTDWAAHEGRARLEARHWSDVDDLNRRARALLGPRGPCVTAGGRDYCAGEPVIVRRSSASAGLTKGRVGNVVAVDPERQRLRILFDGETLPVDLAARRIAPAVLAHAYAVPTACRTPRQGPIFTLDARRATGDDEHEIHHYVATGPGALPARAVDRSAVQAALIDAIEERDAARHWATAGVPGASARLAVAEEAVRRQQQRAARLDVWIADHHPELRELAELDKALARRAELVDRAAELFELQPRPLRREPGRTPAERLHLPTMR